MGTKRRGHHEGTFNQRGDVRWEAQISLPAGQRKSLYGKTRKEVQDRLRAVQREIEAGVDVATSRQTVGTFLDHWLVSVRTQVRPTTYGSYEQTVRVHLTPALGRRQLAALMPQHVQALLAETSAAGRSPRTVQYMGAVLRQALAKAVKWGFVPRNVAALADSPRSVSKPVQPLTPDQARAFIAATQSDRLGPLFAVAISAGLCQGELFGLRWDDVDLDAGKLTVRHALQRIEGKPTLVEPKTKRSRRTISLPALAIDALTVQQARQVEQRLAACQRWTAWNLVVASTIGTPLDPSNVTARLHALLAAAGLPRQQFHDLRHCGATLLLTQGVSPRVVMEVLGHSQISLTMNTYSHVLPSMLKDAAAALDAALGVAG